MRIYLSGPMTGLPDLNYPAFARAASLLRGMGHEVYNPAEWETYGVPSGLTDDRSPRRPFNLEDAFLDYTRWIILHANAVVTLPGWEDSPGASAEVALARAVRKPHYLMPRLGETFLMAEQRVLREQKAEQPPECPQHREQQHRDRQGPWCSRCGWTHGQVAKPAQKLGTSTEERMAVAVHAPYKP